MSGSQLPRGETDEAEIDEAGSNAEDDEGRKGSRDGKAGGSGGSEGATIGGWGCGVNGGREKTGVGRVAGV